MANVVCDPVRWVKISSIACSIISCLAVEIFFCGEKDHLTKLCHLALRVELIMPHRVGIDNHSLTTEKFITKTCTILSFWFLNYLGST